MPRVAIWLSLSIWLIALSGCKSGDSVPGGDGSSEKIRVVVSIAPQAFFVERIGGERVAVTVLVGSGQSPHSYEPTPRQLAELAQAGIFFRIGIPFENALIGRVRSTYPDLVVADTLRDIDLIPMAEEDGAHEHGHDHGHAHGSEDPHVWMDPLLAVILSRNTAAGLARIDPDNAAHYAENHAALAEELKALDRRIRELLDPVAGRSFYMYHPSLGYFAKSYGLRQVSVERDGKEPVGRDLARLIDQGRAERVRVLFADPQFSKATVQTIARSLGAEVEVIDPLAPDYIENLERVAAAIAAALRDEDEPGE